MAKKIDSNLVSQIALCLRILINGLEIGGGKVETAHLLRLAQEVRVLEALLERNSN